ncbi:MAG: ABC transporter permease [Ignavibacteriaceae bacterium]
MFKNYLKIAVRNLTKQKFFSLINILGLTIGLTSVILLVLNIKFEYSFDTFHKNMDRIYRVSVIDKHLGKAEGESYVFVPPIGPAMAKDFPEVENYVRFSTTRTMYFTHGRNSFKIQNVTYADSSLFKIFSFHLLEGNPDKALAAPYSVLLSENTSLKIFGKENPVGKIIQIDNVPFMVTGIIENPPANSDIQFNSIISFATLYRDPAKFMGWNGGNQYITYVLLKKNASAEQVDKKFPDFLWSYLNQDLSKIGIKYEACLQPLKDIHLNYNEDSSSLKDNIKIFSVVALFILLIACVNFINLSTARAGSRAKEVGMRKVLGAQRRSLIFQFLAESILICIVVLMLSFMLVELLMPWYNNLIDKQLQLSNLVDPEFIVFLLLLLTLTEIAAGLYPSLFLSSYKPINTLRGNLYKGDRKLVLRRFLVILQFVISIVLIVSTIVINSQLNFMRSKKLGFDKENIVVIPLVNDKLKIKYQVFKNELKGITGVVNVSATSDVPSNGFSSNGYFPEGSNTPLMIHVVDVDDDFLNTFNIKLVKGRNFNKDIQSDENAYLINESLAKLLGWKEPVNKKIIRNGTHQVIGEVEDFNYASLYYKIEPLIITHQPWQNKFDFMSVKIRPGNISRTMNSIREVWYKFVPTVPFEYDFLDQAFDKIYKSDIKFREAFLIFSILAIFVALLGLLGLASYTVELKTKEIGIRKVLGSTVSGIILLLSKEYFKWIIAANLIAWPIAYYIMHKWLQSFAYSIGIEFWIFIVAGLLVLFSALLIVCIQVFRAATANPVKSLRYE